MKSKTRKVYFDIKLIFYAVGGCLQLKVNNDNHRFITYKSRTLLFSVIQFHIK